MSDRPARSGRSRKAAPKGAPRAAPSTACARTERDEATTSPADAPATAPAAPVEGASPLDVQLATMRALFAKAHRRGKIIDFVQAQKACDIAKQAAPYVHSRLGTADGMAHVQVRHEDVLDQLG